MAVAAIPALRPAPSLMARLTTPRMLLLLLALMWLPLTLHVEGFRGRQLYDVDGQVRERRRGVDFTLRHVAGSATAVQLQLRARDRTFSRLREDAPEGFVFGPELGLEQRLVDAHRLKLDGGLRAFRALPSLGSDLDYFRGVATLEGRVFLSPPEGASLEASVLAVRLRGDRGNPTAVGARVELIGANPRAQEIHAGSGYLSQSSPAAWFGKVNEGARVRVRWPDGETTEHALERTEGTVTLAR